LVYADLAAVIGSTKRGRWVADCTPEEFAAELMAHTGADAATLAIPDSLSRRGNPRAAGLLGGVATLAGSFAAYSPACHRLSRAVWSEAPCVWLPAGTAL